MNTFVDALTELIVASEKAKSFALPLQWVSLAPGIPDLDENVIFFGLEAGKTYPTVVAKTPRLPENKWALQIEYDRLTELWRLLGPEAEYRLQKIIAMAELQGQPVLVTTFLRGENLLRVTRKSLWQAPARLLSLSIDVAQSLRSIMDQTATPLTDGEKIDSGFSEKIEKYKQMYAPPNAELQTLDALALEVESAALKVDHKILIQGDFWHGNMIRSAEHGKLMLLDWQYARWSKDVSLDLYMFLLAGALTAVPKQFVNAPVEARAQAALEILRAWNRQIIPAYLNAFGTPTKYTVLPMRSGMLVCCVENAVRASMNRNSEKTQDFIWRALFSGLCKGVSNSVGF